MYNIKNEQFEGPLDLLLSFIEKEQLDITQISLARITSSYLEAIADMQGDSAELAEFLVVAAKLLYIKSRTLIPSAATEEEEAEIVDLEEKLREYAQYKAAAKHLESVLAEESRGYTRRGKNESSICFTPPGDISSDGLFAIFQDALARVPAETAEKTEIVHEPKVTIGEKRDFIIKKLSKSGPVSFLGILGGAKSKIDIIITFLAVLEMVKQKEVNVEQTGNFADFTLYRL